MKINVLGQFNFVKQLKSYCTDNVRKNIQFKKCLVVSKLSRYEFERHRHGKLSRNELEHLLRNRGTNYEKLLHYHHLHKSFEQKVADTLRSLEIEVRVVNR